MNIGLNQEHIRLFGAAAFLLAVSALGTGCRQYPDCKTNEHCEKYNETLGHDTPLCIDNICQECADDSNCDRGEQCVRNSCSPIPGYCDEEVMCPEPQRCRDNRCGPECLADDECEGAHAYCERGTCQQGECTADTDCEEGYRCEDHVCREIPDTSPCANETFETVYFDFDESALRMDQQESMDWNMACMERFERNVEIAGHTDERGTVGYNLALGERRARTIRNYMRDQGVDRDRIDTISYGESEPAQRGSNATAWSRNRRTELSWDD